MDNNEQLPILEQQKTEQPRLVPKYRKYKALFLFLVFILFSMLAGIYINSQKKSQTTTPTPQAPVLTEEIPVNNSSVEMSPTQTPSDSSYPNCGRYYHSQPTPSYTVELVKRLNTIPTEMNDLQICDIIETIPSPDNQQLIIHAFAGISPSVIYYSDSTMKNIKWIGIALKTIWSPTGRYIAYTYTRGDSGPSKISIYDTKTNNHVGVTNVINSDDCEYSYDNPVWLENEQGVRVNYLKEIQSCPNQDTEVGQTILYLEI